MIAHITTQAEWAGAQQAGVYTAPSLQQQGFIHCSEVTAQQLLAVANSIYTGQPNLVLLLIDPARLTSESRYEEFECSGLFFPHLYGPLNLKAVAEVSPFVPQLDGTFELPKGAWSFYR